MASFTWPPQGAGSGVATYATFAAFPPSAANGTLALALDTDTLYAYNTTSNSWVVIGGAGGVLGIGALDGNGASANGLSIALNTLYAQSASASVAGLVNTTTQTFAGAKFFNTYFQVGGTSLTQARVTPTSNFAAVNTFITSVGYGAVPTVVGYRAGGTEAAPTATPADAIMNAITARGHDGTNFILASKGRIAINAAELFTTTANGTYITFATTPKLATGLLERMRIFDDGNISVGNTTSSAKLSVTGTILSSSTVSGTQLISSVATGTAPLSVASTTLVPNLYVARAVLADTVTTNANLTGDVTSVGNATTIANNVVTNAKLAQMPTLTIKGNNTGGTANALDLTVAQVNTMLGTTGAPTSIGTFDGQAPAANGLTLTGNVLYAQSASASVPGMINTTAQAFLGEKYFNTYLQMGGSSATSALLIPTGLTNAVTVGGLFTSVNYSSGAPAGLLTLRARGSEAAPTAVLDGNTLLVLATSGYDGSTFPVFAGDPGGFIEMTASEDWSPGANGTAMSFYVTPNTTASPALALTLANNTNATFPGTVTSSSFIGNVTGTASGNTTYTPNNHGVVLSGAANAMTVLAPSSSTAFPLISGGASANPTWAKLSEAGGGTNQTTYTTGDLLYASGANTLAKLTIGSSTNVLTVVGGVPAWAAAGTGTVSSVTFTGDGTVLSSTPSSPVTTTGTLTASLLTHSANTFLAGPTSGGAASPTFRAVVAADLPTAAFVAPTVQTFTSGSGTYTLPTSPRSPVYIRVRMVGGGGGGGGGAGVGSSGPGNGGAGGTTTFGTTLLSAVGGSAGTGSGGTGGGGGSASLGSGPLGTALSGGSGSLTNNLGQGGPGGNSGFGGGGGGGADSASTTGPGMAGATNSGSGGGGGGGTVTAGAGGGAGGFIDAIITSPSSTYAYAVGAAGTAGAGATGGSGGSAGGAGGSGYIEVTEYYQ